MSELYEDSGEGTFVEGRDFYYDDTGLIVLTSAYLIARGYCCGSGCRHCPYGNGPNDLEEKNL